MTERRQREKRLHPGKGAAVCFVTRWKDEPERGVQKTKGGSNRGTYRRAKMDEGG